jgi:hypothetical protein
VGHSLPVVLLDLLVNLLSMDGNIERGLNAEFHRVAIDTHDSDHDAAVDHDAFVGLSG